MSWYKYINVYYLAVEGVIVALSQFKDLEFFYKINIIT